MSLHLIVLAVLLVASTTSLSDCLQIAQTIDQCLDNPKSQDTNCQWLRTQQGRTSAYLYIEACRRNFHVI